MTNTIASERVDFFKKNGYLVIKDLFTEEEVLNIKNGCKLNQPGDSICRPEFNNIIWSPKVIGIVKELLGEKIYYLAMSETWTNNASQLYVPRSTHADVVDDDGDFDTEYPIINVAVYLQDYVNYSDGLKIYPGSHKRPCIRSLSLFHLIKNVIKRLLVLDMRGALNVLDFHHSINIPSTERDLIIWSMRTHHSGHAVRLKGLTDWSLPPVIENFVPSIFRLPNNPERDVLITKFAGSSKYLEPYIQKQIVKIRRKEHYLNNACFESEIKKTLANEMGIIIRNDGYRYFSRQPRSS